VKIGITATAVAITIIFVFVIYIFYNVYKIAIAKEQCIQLWHYTDKYLSSHPDKIQTNLEGNHNLQIANTLSSGSILTKKNVNGALIDPWGTELIIQITRADNGDDYITEIFSAGPDKKHHTQDDIVINMQNK
jgi:hypothetical protein